MTAADPAPEAVMAKFPCPHCSRSFSRRGRLDRHLRLSHDVVAPRAPGPLPRLAVSPGLRGPDLRASVPFDVRKAAVDLWMRGATVDAVAEQLGLPRLTVLALIEPHRTNPVEARERIRAGRRMRTERNAGEPAEVGP
ncbi:MAG TPA: C2H2-type zinc finger protein [Thermoplasmata archaeon]|nr:C2H2-type zinc finger protein [Thermoplasmata archaeon]